MYFKQHLVSILMHVCVYKCNQQSSVLRRRGPKVTIHAGRGCGPCQLCHKSAPFFLTFVHLEYWSMSDKLCAIGETVSDDSCICRACENDIKRTPHWTSAQNKEHILCIAHNCGPLYIHARFIISKYMIWSTLHDILFTSTLYCIIVNNPNYAASLHVQTSNYSKCAGSL